MKNNYQENLEHALDLALGLQKKGVPEREILERFPQFKGELEPLLSLARAAEMEKKSIVPSRALLSRIMAHLYTGVTEKSLPRLKKGGYGRASFMSFVRNTMSPFRLAVPVGAVILLLLVIGIRQFGTEKPEQLSLKVDELESEMRDLESIGERSVSPLPAFPEEGTSVSPSVPPSAAIMGAPQEPEASAMEQAAAASETEELESDFREFDEFTTSDAEIDQAFSELE